MDGVDLGLGPAPMAPDLPEPSQVNPSKTSQLIKLALMGLAGGLGPGAGTGIMQGLYRSEQERQQQAQLTDRQNMQRFQYQQQQYQQQARDYEQQQALKQKAVADAFAQLGKDAPNFTTRAEFEQRATLYSQQLQMMGIRVPPQALMQQVPYLEPSERDVIAEAINKNQKQFPDAWDGGAPLAAHIQYRDPKTGETRDIQIGKALEAGLVSLPVDTATGKWIGSEAKKPVPNLTPREGVMNGRPVFWTMGENGTPQEVKGVSPTPPASSQSGGGGAFAPRIQQRIDAKGKEFNAQPVVKRIQQMAEAVSFADSLDINTNNPNDDQALIYSFAKAMDPDSVVREGEYATVQKYAQSWAQTFGFNAQRIFSNSAFLTPQARANMKATIRSKYQSAIPQYKNVRQNYVSQVDRIAGQPGAGNDWIVDYEAAFPQEPQKPATASPDVNAARERARQMYKQRQGGK